MGRSTLPLGEMRTHPSGFVWTTGIELGVVGATFYHLCHISALPTGGFWNGIMHHNLERRHMRVRPGFVRETRHGDRDRHDERLLELPFGIGTRPGFEAE
eukprot:1184084-Prorocentrum_minimum.AAC.1